MRIVARIWFLDGERLKKVAKIAKDEQSTEAKKMKDDSKISTPVPHRRISLISLKPCVVFVVRQLYARVKFPVTKMSKTNT
jgi:hypothetical protein